MMWLLRKAFSSVGTAEQQIFVIDRIMHTKSNAELIDISHQLHLCRECPFIIA
jgi:transcription termination factor Rho